MVASTAIHKSILIAVGASKLVTIVAMVHRDANLAAAVASCAHHEPLVSAASAHLDSYLSSEMTSVHQDGFELSDLVQLGDVGVAPDVYFPDENLWHRQGANVKGTANSLLVLLPDVFVHADVALVHFARVRLKDGSHCIAFLERFTHATHRGDVHDDRLRIKYVNEEGGGRSSRNVSFYVCRNRRGWRTTSSLVFDPLSFPLCSPSLERSTGAVNTYSFLGGLRKSACLRRYPNAIPRAITYLFEKENSLAFFFSETDLRSWYDIALCVTTKGTVSDPTCPRNTLALGTSK